ncbi:hypothetical protein Trydic_g1247 [Trypoxylus dichotomus]
MDSDRGVTIMYSTHVPSEKMGRIRGKTLEELNSYRGDIRHVTNFIGIEIASPTAPQICGFISGYVVLGFPGGRHDVISSLITLKRVCSRQSVSLRR